MSWFEGWRARRVGRVITEILPYVHPYQKKIKDNHHSWQKPMLSAEFGCAGFSVGCAALPCDLPVPSKRAGQGAKEGGAQGTEQPHLPQGRGWTKRQLLVVSSSAQVALSPRTAASFGKRQHGQPGQRGTSRAVLGRSSPGGVKCAREGREGTTASKAD